MMMSAADLMYQNIKAELVIMQQKIFVASQIELNKYNEYGYQIVSSLLYW